MPPGASRQRRCRVVEAATIGALAARGERRLAAMRSSSCWRDWNAMPQELRWWPRRRRRRRIAPRRRAVRSAGAPWTSELSRRVELPAEADHVAPAPRGRRGTARLLSCMVECSAATTSSSAARRAASVDGVGRRCSSQRAAVQRQPARSRGARQTRQARRRLRCAPMTRWQRAIAPDPSRPRRSSAIGVPCAKAGDAGDRSASDARAQRAPAEQPWAGRRGHPSPPGRRRAESLIDEERPQQEEHLVLGGDAAEQRTGIADAVAGAGRGVAGRIALGGVVPAARLADLAGGAAGRPAHGPPSTPGCRAAAAARSISASPWSGRCSRCRRARSR